MLCSLSRLVQPRTARICLVIVNDLSLEISPKISSRHPSHVYISGRHRWCESCQIYNAIQDYMSMCVPGNKLCSTMHTVSHVKPRSYARCTSHRYAESGLMDRTKPRMSPSEIVGVSSGHSDASHSSSARRWQTAILARWMIRREYLGRLQLRGVSVCDILESHIPLF